MKAIQRIGVSIICLAIVLTNNTFLLAVAGEVNVMKADLTLGKTIYKRDCTICHGSVGNGAGPASSLLTPKPRDFTKGVYKLRSTPGLPTNDDLFRTINNGIPGTLMPAFGHLSENERWALVAYVKSFSEQFKSGESLGPILVPNAPPQSSELVFQGKKLFQEAGCFQCHGSSGKGDGPSSKTLIDSWGNPIVPYDFTIPGKMKGGSTVEDIYRTLIVGIGGTPMPAYNYLAEKEIWALAHYVLSLADGEIVRFEEGDPDSGRYLFTGVERLSGGGPACISCHSISGLGKPGIGAFFGPDLNPAYSKFGEDGIPSVLTDLPFPTMRAVFSKHSFTQEEINHLKSFFRQTTLAQQQKPVVSELWSAPAYFGSTSGLATIGVVFLTILGLRFGRKETGV